MTGSPNIWAYEKRKRCITHTNMVVKYTTCMNAVDSSIAVYRCILCSACKRIRPLSCVGFFKLVWTPLLYLLSLFCLWSGVPPSVKEGCTTSTRLRDNKRNSSSMGLRFMHVARAMRFLFWNLSWFLFPGPNQKQFGEAVSFVMCNAKGMIKGSHVHMFQRTHVPTFKRCSDKQQEVLRGFPRPVSWKSWATLDSRSWLLPTLLRKPRSSVANLSACFSRWG